MAQLPPHILKDYLTPEQIVEQRRLMIGTEGETNTGKSEFIMSAPGPGILLAVDRNIDGVMYNPKPPKNRQPGWVVKIITVPKEGQEDQAGFKKYWQEAFYPEYKKALGIPELRSMGLDGDSDSWELQRLAHFGKLMQIPSIMYTDCNASRRAMIARAYDSGKIIIATNKITDIYVDKTDANGNVVLASNGKAVQVKSGEQRRQGFGDHKYLWQIQLRHMFKPEAENKYTKKVMPAQFGIRLLECKPNMELKGQELWGDDCNFRSLVELVYPHIDPESWYR